MSFGRNPHVAKALAAEQKAQEAPDDLARVQAYRDAAHQWDRAAAREQRGKRKTEYEQKATHARELADSPADEPKNEPEGGGSPAPPVDPRLLN